MKSFGLFFHAFLSIFDVNALCGIVDSPATQIVDDCGGIVGGNGMDSCVVAVHAGDGEAETRVMGKPDKVAVRVEGDFRNLIYSHCSMSKRPINIGKVKL